MNLKTVCSKGVKYAERKRIARGPGSGLGKTAGRGHKGWGQRSGASRRPGYEGGQMPIYRRVPKRGFTNARFRTEYTVINVGELGSFDDGASVDLEAVLAHGLTSKVTPLFKVLGNGELARKLTVRAQKFSKSAVEKIQKAGGTVVNVDDRGREIAPEAVAASAEATRKGSKAQAPRPVAEKTTDAKPADAEAKSGKGKDAKAKEGKAKGAKSQDAKPKDSGTQGGKPKGEAQD